MRKAIKGFTIIETLIGITLLAVIMGGILGAFIVVQRYFKDGVAMAQSQATARIVIEKIVRPDVREGSKFSIPPEDGGNTFILTKYDGTEITFAFVDDDGDDETLDDNVIEKTENEVTTTIGKNIVMIPDEEGVILPLFTELEENERVGINFGVKNEGIVGRFKEVHISTEMKLRN